MISELSVKNLALIEDIHVEFDKGLSIFTGETGAGKSILIEAIGLLLGDRADADMVRSGADEADVTGVFAFAKVPAALKRLLDDAGVDCAEGQIVVRRRIARAGGRNRVLINQTHLPLGVLKQAGDLLIDFHSQHEHQSLLVPETACVIVDALPQVSSVRRDYDAAYQRFVSAQEALDKHLRDAAALSERREFLEFQHNELSALGLAPGEEEDLERELLLLSTTADRLRSIADIAAALGDGDAAINDRLGAVRKRLETLAKLDDSVSPWLTDVEGAARVLAELETFCGSYGDVGLSSADPNRIEEINSRLAKIQRLKKKHACTLAQLIDKAADLKRSLDALGNSASDRKELEKARDVARTGCLDKGKDLTRVRAKATRAFDAQISAHMATLGFDRGVWKTDFRALEQPGPSGMESIEFLVQTNPGEPLLPLIKIASGGEIARLMLAIKSVVAAHDHIPILIFDEVDSGIGGVLANEVAAALRGLSTSHQVICITHLHQIASTADHHFHVYKESAGARTVTRVEELTGDRRVAEIARMLGGESEIARKHARELLKGAR